MNDLPRQMFTPPQVGKIWGVTPEKVIGWIKRGELAAINVSDGDRRPRYLIDVRDLAAFQARRRVGAKIANSTPRPRRLKPEVQLF